MRSIHPSLSHRRRASGIVAHVDVARQRSPSASSTRRDASIVGRACRRRHHRHRQRSARAASWHHHRRRVVTAMHRGRALRSSIHWSRRLRRRGLAGVSACSTAPWSCSTPRIGVKPQTESVGWREADARAIPRIVFVNKVDCVAKIRQAFDPSSRRSGHHTRSSSRRRTVESLFDIVRLERVTPGEGTQIARSASPSERHETEAQAIIDVIARFDDSLGACLSTADIHDDTSSAASREHARLATSYLSPPARRR